MSMDPAQSPVAMPATQQSFSDVWLKALTQPSVATYENFLSRPGVGLGRAFIWVFVGSFVGSMIAFLGLYLSGRFSNLGLDQASGIAPGVSFLLILFVCGVPISAAFGIIGLVVVAGVGQLAARLLGGKGSFTELAYALSAYLAPMSIVTALLGIIPFIGCLNIFLAIYGMFLNVVAVKAVHRFDWGRAVISSLAFLAVILVLVGCIVVVLLALVGPMVGNVFSNVIQGLGTPLP